MHGNNLRKCYPYSPKVFSIVSKSKKILQWNEMSNLSHSFSFRKETGTLNTSQFSLQLPLACASGCYWGYSQSVDSSIWGPQVGSPTRPSCWPYWPRTTRETWPYPAWDNVGASLTGARCKAGDRLSAVVFGHTDRTDRLAYTTTPQVQPWYIKRGQSFNLALVFRCWKSIYLDNVSLCCDMLMPSDGRAGSQWSIREGNIGLVFSSRS